MPILPVPTPTVVLAEPATLAAGLAKVGCGQVLKLAAGDYPGVVIKGRECSEKPLRIDGSAGARLVNAKLLSVKGFHFDRVSLTTLNIGNAMLVQDSSDVTFTGGWVTGAEGGNEGKGISVVRSVGVGADGVAFKDLAVGLAFAVSQHVWAINSRFEHMGVDGVDVGNSQYALIQFNAFYGTERLGTKHADAVQLVTKDGQPMTADVDILDNIVIGETQGITGFGPRYGRVNVQRNTIWISSSQALAFNGADPLTLKDNHVRPLAGATGWPSINVSASNVVERSGNTMAGAFGKAAKDDPAP